MHKKILLYGYGNPGRQDDGLGPRFIDKIKDWIEQEKIDSIKTDSNYQLNIEDANEIADKDLVIFIDASIEPIENFCITKVTPNSKIEFTMHAAAPSFILSLCNKLYQKYPDTYLLHIKGYEWELKEELTEKGEKNLIAALEIMKIILKEPDLISDYIE